MEEKKEPQNEKKEESPVKNPLDELIIKRANLLLKAEKDRKLQQALNIKCFYDIFFWIENFVWIYEPRIRQGENTKLPMSLEGRFSYEKKIIEKVLQCINEEKDLHIEKSRDMGLTWLLIVIAVWGWRFHEWESLFGSRTADDLDKLGNLKTLFPKARFLIKNLPKWMLPKTFSKERHMGWMNIINPEFQCSVSGQANSQNFASGTRCKFIVFDEFAKWEHTDRNAWTSAGPATPCRIAVSTPFFKNNKFYELVDEKTGEKSIEHLKVHYSQDLKKDIAWKEKEKQRHSEDEWNQEYEISYSGTTYSGVYVEEMKYMRQHDRITSNVAYIPEREIYVAIDFGIGDTTALSCFQATRWGEEVNLFNCYDNANKPIDHYIYWLKSIDREWNKEANGKYKEGWRNCIIIPDPNQATNREMQTGKTLQQILENAELEVQMQWIGSMEGISLTKQLLKRCRIKSGLRVIDALENYHYKFDVNRNEFKREPMHDWSSHFCDSVKYFAAFLNDPDQQKQDFEEEENIYNSWAGATTAGM